jgi:hypothetical protein
MFCPDKHAHPEELGRLMAERAERDEPLEVADALRELADVHGPVRLGHIRDHYVEATAVGERRVDEGRRQVHAAAG